MKKIICLLFLLINTVDACQDTDPIAKLRNGIINIEPENFKIINNTKYSLCIRLAPIKFFFNSIELKTEFSHSFYQQDENIVFIHPDCTTIIKLIDFIQDNNVLVSFIEAKYFKVSFTNLINQKLFFGYSDWIKFKNESNYIVTIDKNNSSDDCIKLNVQAY